MSADDVVIPKSRPTCSDCLAFSIAPGNDGAMVQECRRKSPLAIMVQTAAGTGSFGAWPPTRPEMWCCEFLPMKPAQWVRVQ